MSIKDKPPSREESDGGKPRKRMETDFIILNGQRLENIKEGDSLDVMDEKLAAMEKAAPNDDDDLGPVGRLVGGGLKFILFLLVSLALVIVLVIALSIASFIVLMVGGVIFNIEDGVMNLIHDSVLFQLLSGIVALIMGVRAGWYFVYRSRMLKRDPKTGKIAFLRFVGKILFFGFFRSD